MEVYYEYTGSGEEAVIFDFGEAYLFILGWEKINDEDGHDVYSHKNSKFQFEKKIYKPIGKNENITWDMFWKSVSSDEKDWVQKRFFKTILE